MDWMILVLFIFSNSDQQGSYFKKTETVIQDSSICWKIAEQMNKDRHYVATCMYKDTLTGQ